MLNRFVVFCLNLGETWLKLAGTVHSQASLTPSHDITSFVGQHRDVMRWPPASSSALRDCKLVAIPGALSSKTPASFPALRDCKLVAISGALSSKTRGPSSVLYDSKP